MAGSEHPYSVQMHIHASGSEGAASMLAHDRMATRTGSTDVIWWTEHDWRLANFSKISRYEFDAEEKLVQFPSRVPQNGLPPVEVRAWWQADDETNDDPACSAGWSDERSYDGRGALRVEASATASGPGSASCTLMVDNYRHRFPLFSRPQIAIAVYYEKEATGADATKSGEAFVECVLSQQPPELRHARIRYVLGSGTSQDDRADDRLTLVVPIAGEPGTWNVIRLDPASDAARLGLPADGLDNALYDLRLGVRALGGTVRAYFDALEIEPENRGTAVLDTQRRLAVELPTQVKHLVGVEVSWYGQHVNAFGSNVPIPDYETLEPEDLTTAEIVDHIHRYGGLACYNHPPVDDLDTFSRQMAEHEAFGAEAMEVAHRAKLFDERFALWDALSEQGVLVTGVGVGDSHDAQMGWEANDRAPCWWVTRIWAGDLTEEHLLDALAAGRVYFADPSQFRGALDITGPGGSRMGDVVIAGDGVCELTVSVTDARPGDELVWFGNGTVAGRDVLSAPSGSYSIDVGAPYAGVRGYRVELLRIVDPSGTPVRIACTNPLYVAPSEDAVKPRSRARLLDRTPEGVSGGTRVFARVRTRR